jgi:hypothetical protein
MIPPLLRHVFGQRGASIRAAACRRQATCFNHPVKSPSISGRCQRRVVEGGARLSAIKGRGFPRLLFVMSFHAPAA